MRKWWENVLPRVLVVLWFSTLTFWIASSSSAVAQVGPELVIVKPVEPGFLEAMYKSVGTRTFNVQYFRLFLDNDIKGYIVKAWIFSPSTLAQAPKFEVKLVNPSTKATYKFDFPSTRSGSYYRLSPLLVVCPQDFRILVNDQELPYETAKKSGETIEIPVHGEFGPGIRVLRRTASGFEEIFEASAATKNDDLFIQIIAGTFPTGGYSIQVNEPDIVYPVTGKRGRITITGTFLRPGKGDVVTQAFTTPSTTVVIGRLPSGDYDIFVKIEGLGEFFRTLKVQ